MIELDGVNYFSQTIEPPCNFDLKAFYTSPDNMLYIKQRGPLFSENEQAFLYYKKKYVTISHVNWSDIPDGAIYYGGWWYNWKFDRESDREIESSWCRHGGHEVHLRKINDHNDVTYWLNP